MTVLVGIRCRREEGTDGGWQASSSTTIELDGKKQTFDHVFTSHKNIEVYNSSCRQVVERVVEGYNGTIAAYGQSGAGKTHTLLGARAEKGVLQLAVGHLLELIKERASVQYMVKISVFEIYNENLVDLLDDTNSKNCRIIGEKVIGAVEEIVESNEHFLRLCQKAQDRRSVGETRLNQKSSRSHAVFQLIVEACQLDDLTGCQSTTVSKFVVLDLAGSENAKSMTNATQTAESRKINLSLLALSRVISEIAENPNKKCLMFRDSLLTRILQPVIGGNSQFLLICCIRSSGNSETASTLSFGQKAKKMPNQMKKNVESKEASLPVLLAEINDLKRQLEETKKDSVTAQGSVRLEEMLKKVFNLNTSQSGLVERKPRRRHSIAIGASMIPSPKRRPQRVSATACDLFHIEENETELDSGRSSRTSGCCSRMSIEERPMTPAIGSMEDVRTALIPIEKSSYEEMVQLVSSMKEEAKQLFEKIRIQQSEMDSAAKREANIRQELDSSEKQRLAVTAKVEELKAGLIQKENEIMELRTQADKNKNLFEDLKTKGLRMLNDKDELLCSEVARQKAHSRQVKEQMRKITDMERKFSELEMASQRSLDEKNREIERLKAEVVRKEREHGARIKKEKQRVTDLTDKYVDMKTRGLEMLRKVEHDLVICRTEKDVLEEKLADMKASTRGIRSTVTDQSGSNKDPEELIFKLDILVRQRELLVARINTRSGDLQMSGDP